VKGNLLYDMEEESPARKTAGCIGLGPSTVTYPALLSRRLIHRPDDGGSMYL
jgi:hypothetical protein